MSHKILTVGFELPGAVATYADFQSRTSLLDWDLIIFSTGINDSFSSHETYRGKPCFSDDESFLYTEAKNHWRKEISTAYRSGKTIFVFLGAFEQVYVATGEKRHSGTGRNQKTTRIVDLSDNFEMLPSDLKATNAIGKNMALNPKYQFLKEYWAGFESDSEFQVTFQSSTMHPLISTKSGNLSVGGFIQDKTSNGSILALPAIDFYKKEFTSTRDGKEYWTTKAKEYGNRLLGSLVGIVKEIRSFSDRTPQPDWIESTNYILPAEEMIRGELLSLESQSSTLLKNIETKKTELENETSVKALLYEQGKSLENAILHSLRLLGFTVSRYKENDSEFDVVFESPEGRLLGEAEGKDNKAINIDKLRQLEMNINEDFSRDEIESIAKGVLFGNAFRLAPPEKREQGFTEKCIIAATRSKTALVNTKDLFSLVQQLPSYTPAQLSAIRNHLIASDGIVDFSQFTRGDSSQNVSIDEMQKD